MSHLMDEIASQPECWAKAIELAAPAGSAQKGSALPAPGERVAVIGCGSSLNVARGYASLREATGQGETDAFPASEVLATRCYDHMVFVSRTGTTTEMRGTAPGGGALASVIGLSGIAPRPFMGRPASRQPF